MNYRNRVLSTILLVLITVTAIFGLTAMLHGLQNNSHTCPISIAAGVSCPQNIDLFAFVNTHINLLKSAVSATPVKSPAELFLAAYFLITAFFGIIPLSVMKSKSGYRGATANYERIFLERKSLKNWHIKLLEWLALAEKRDCNSSRSHGLLLEFFRY